MKVALCAPNFPPEFLGGTERVVLALARALRDAGDEVLIVAGSDRPHAGHDVVHEDFDGFAVRRLPRLPEEEYGLDVTRPRVAARFADVLLAERVDVVHVHHWAVLSSGLLRAARDIGIPGVATLHDMWTNCPRFFRRPPAGHSCPASTERGPCTACVRAALSHLDADTVRNGIRGRDADLRAELAAASAVTAPSAACARLIAAHTGFDSALEIVPHGLLEEVTEVRTRALDPGCVRVGTFGNLVEEKGVMLLVYAMRGIEAAELHLHGPFLDSAFAALVAERAREFGVQLVEHGPYGPDDPHPALELDLAVFPSLCEETYGLVVEEALARGVPVVVSDRGALAERIGNGGIAVAVDELGPLEAALHDLCRFPQKIEELRRGIPDRFATIADAAMRYRGLYENARATALPPPRDHLFPPLLPKEPIEAPVLVLAAHPDDEVIAAGGMIAWHRARGDRVVVVHVTDGALGDPDARFGDIASVRRSEGREALGRLGVDEVRTLGYPDGGLPDALSRLVPELRALFEELRPRTLYSFFFTEAHRDHRALAWSMAEASDSLDPGCRCLLFGVNQVVVGATMFDVGAFMEQKQHALSAFESQLAYSDWREKILHRDHATTVNIEDPAIQHAEIFVDLRPAELREVRDLATRLYRRLMRSDA
ncbi:MAG: PIG-L family deacetylase [Planctomycetota bacterium]|nr:PIG-L family deacetylase [Planctomycetota bacterium]